MPSSARQGFAEGLQLDLKPGLGGRDRVRAAVQLALEGAHADGGVVGTKPYAASGKYIQRMSNYCADCTYSVKKRYGADACPFNTFYWDFLLRHEARFSSNRRMTLTLKHVERMDADERSAIRTHADLLRKKLRMA